MQLAHHCYFYCSNNCFTFDGFWESFNYFVVSNDSFIALISYVFVCACPVSLDQMQLSNFLLKTKLRRTDFHLTSFGFNFPSLFCRVQKHYITTVEIKNNWHAVTPQTTIVMQQRNTHTNTHTHRWLQTK